MTHEEFDVLYERYLTGRLDDREAEALRECLREPSWQKRWRDLSDLDGMLADEVKLAAPRYRRMRPLRTGEWSRIAAIAAVMFVAAAGAMLFLKRPAPERPKIAEVPVPPPAPVVEPRNEPLNKPPPPKAPQAPKIEPRSEPRVEPPPEEPQAPKPQPTVLEPARAVAVVERSTGDATPRGELFPGQGLRTGRASSAFVRFPDGSILQVEEDTTIREFAGNGKKIFLEKGALSANVARQPEDQPMVLTTPTAEARIVGTCFTLAAFADSTRLEVHQGLVRLTRRLDGAAVDVSAGCRAVASSAALESLPVTQWYVSADGSPDGYGTARRPWDLKTALGRSFKPGDTVWVREGTYVGNFSSMLSGAPSGPIKVRAQGRATIKGSLRIHGSHAWYWGLEIAGSSSDGVVVSSEASNDPGLKLIHLVIHDNASAGLFLEAGAVDAELHGCLVYRNGPGAHGLWLRNKEGIKLVRDNMFFGNSGSGISLFGTDKADRDNITFEGNVWFDNGAYNFYAGGGRLSEGLKLVRNLSYSSPGAARQANRVHDTRGAVLEENFFIGPGPDKESPLDLKASDPGLVVRGNTFYGKLAGFAPAQFPQNLYLSARPQGRKAFVRPSPYEPGRANITVYNWDAVTAVEIETRLLKAGDRFEIRDAQDFFGKPVLSGVHRGGPVRIPVQRFGAFVLLKEGGA